MPEKERTRATRKKNSAKPEPSATPVVRDRVIVTDDALATIIGLAAHEVPGVIGMAPASIREGIKRILGAQQADEGVVVGHAEEGTNLDIHVVVAYGVNIPAVADSIRERIQYAARQYAGVDVAKVRVHVAGVSRA